MNHFEPGLKGPEVGIGFLLEAVYDALVGLKYDVVYLESASQYLSERPVDLFVGLESGFNRATLLLKPRMSILLSVNRVRTTRPEWLSRFLLVSPRSWLRLGHEENLYLFTFPERTAGATIQLGRHNSVAPARLKSAFFSMRNPALDTHHPEDRNYNDCDTVLFYFGSICLRKGLDYLEQEAKFLSKRISSSGNDIKIVVHGWSSNQRNLRAMSRLALLPGVKWSSEFLKSDSDEYLELFRRAKLAVFPSFEEGQQDAVAQAIALGVPSLVAESCGFEGLLGAPSLAPDDYKAWTDSIVELTTNSPVELAQIAAQQFHDLKALPSTAASVDSALRQLVVAGQAANPLLRHSGRRARVAIWVEWCKGFIRFPVTNSVLALSRLLAGVNTILRATTTQISPRLSKNKLVT